MTYPIGKRFSMRPTRRRLVPHEGAAAVAMAAVSLSPVTTPGPAAAAADAPPACQPVSAGGPLFITASCVDPVLDQPYVDAEHGGTMTDPTTGVTVSYLYVHGGFSGTDARFAFYFPAADAYKGRFFETTYPTVSQENASPGCTSVGTSACSVVFAVSNGAYVVSTNNAGGVQTGSPLAAYRANAAAAKYSRVIAAQVYGTSARPRGYLYGASGGAYQTVGAMENTSGVWDGAVPMVFGAPNAIPSFMTVELLALRVLGDKLAQVADAMAPGGSGDPYAGLTAEQQSVLHEVTRLGFPLRGWWQYATLNGGAFDAVEAAVRAIDPTYATDFWTKPGYEGYDNALQGATRVQYATTVSSTSGSTLALSGMPAGVPADEITGADLIVTSGPLAQRSVQITSVSGDSVQLAQNPGITPGTSVEIDNSWLIALEYYQRHQVPTPDEYAWNQYRGPSGLPLEPQRPVLVGPILAANTAGSVANGHFHGKMIMLESAMDVQAYPWSADWYRKQAQSALGASFAGSYRLWYMDNADHDPQGPAATNAADAVDHIVPYTGEVQQALLDLDAWVAKGVAPPASTSYTVDANDQIQLAPTALKRHGVQPVVTLTARAGAHTPPGDRIYVAAGQPVTLSMKAQVPPGTGKIVKVEWDFQGTGSFTTTPLTHIGPEVDLHETYTFTRPGTYFPVVRVTSQRDGNPAAPYGMIQNLAGVRVVVQ